MIARLRADLGADGVPLVIGEIGHFRPENAEFNAGIPGFARRIPRCSYVSTDGLKDKGDGLHFDTPSQYILGQRYAAAYMALAAQYPRDPAVASP
jgi:hypothetical protein